MGMPDARKWARISTKRCTYDKNNIWAPLNSIFIPQKNSEVASIHGLEATQNFPQKIGIGVYSGALERKYSSVW